MHVADLPVPVNLDDIISSGMGQHTAEHSEQADFSTRTSHTSRPSPPIASSMDQARPKLNVSPPG